MSQVRRCDRCGTIFSELERGWQTYTATTMEDDPQTGNPVEIRQAMDACPSCALVPRRVFDRETTATLEGRARDARIAQLERENGLDDDTGTFVQEEEGKAKA